MPWWGTELHVAAFDAGENAATPQFAGSHIVAGGQGKEALGEPNWGVGDGEWGAKTLFFSSDRTGFSNVYRVTVESTHGGSEVAVSKVEPVLKEPVQADTQTPAWTLGK